MVGAVDRMDTQLAVTIGDGLLETEDTDRGTCLRRVVSETTMEWTPGAGMLVMPETVHGLRGLPEKERRDMLRMWKEEVEELGRLEPGTCSVQDLERVERLVSFVCVRGTQRFGVSMGWMTRRQDVEPVEVAGKVLTIRQLARVVDACIGSPAGRREGCTCSQTEGSEGCVYFAEGEGASLDAKWEDLDRYQRMILFCALALCALQTLVKVLRETLEEVDDEEGDESTTKYVSVVTEWILGGWSWIRLASDRYAVENVEPIVLG